MNAATIETIFIINSSETGTIYYSANYEPLSIGIDAAILGLCEL